eukprot:3263170-Alexandrium_andersonii.AAC.1
MTLPEGRPSPEAMGPARMKGALPGEGCSTRGAMLNTCRGAKQTVGWALLAPEYCSPPPFRKWR